MERRTQKRARKSPSRYAPEPISPRKASTKKSPSKSDLSSRTRSRSQSASRKSPSRSQKNQKPKSPKQKSISPVKSNVTQKIKDKMEAIRVSITPDKKTIEDRIRSSVTRFEEVTSEIVTSISKATRNKLNKSVSITPDKDLEDKMTTILPQENNIKSYGAGKGHSNRKEETGPSAEFGKSIVTLFLMVIIPVFALAAQLACTKENCSLVPSKVFTSWAEIFDQEAAFWYLGFISLQFILNSIPLGPTFNGLPMEDGEILNYRSHGMVSLILNGAILAGIYYYTKFPLTIILDKTIPLLTMAILGGIVASVGLYIKARYGTKNQINLLGSNKTIVKDMWYGLETNPRIGFCDVKMMIFQVSFIFSIIYDAILILKEFEGKTVSSQYSLGLIMLCIMQISCFMLFFVFESSMLTSFAFTQEKTGYVVMVFLSIYPFWITLMPKYLSLTEVSDNVWVIVGATLMHVTGFAIWIVSTLQLARFKRNPLAERASDVVKERQTGLDLYKGGLWSWVRHPNYTGYLIMHLAWGLLCTSLAPYHWIPITIPLFILIDLLGHIKRVEGKTLTRHPTSWVTYSNSVKNKIIPHIY